MAAWGAGHFPSGGQLCRVCVCLGIARPSLPEPTPTPPRPPLRCGLAQQLSPEHLLGAWLHARRRGWESKVSWALPDPSPTEPFLSLPSRGSFFPRRIPPRSTPAPTSCPGLPLPQPSLIPDLRARRGLCGRGQCQGHPGKCFQGSPRFWEMCILPRSPISIALAVMDCFLTVARSSADIGGEDRSLQRVHCVLSRVLLRGQAAAVKPTSPQMSGVCKLIGCEGLRVEFGVCRKRPSDWYPVAVGF